MCRHQQPVEQAQIFNNSNKNSSRSKAGWHWSWPRRNRTTSHFRPALLHLLLLLLLILPLTTMAASSSRIVASPDNSPPIFTTEERAQLRQAFLRKFGLDHLASSVSSRKRQAMARPKVPDYIWALYEAHSTASPATVQAQTIRHYGPAMVQKAGEGRAGLAFNLSATGRDTSKEHVVHAELRLPNWKMPSPNATLTVFRRQTDDGTELLMASKQWAEFEQMPWIDLEGEMFTAENGTRTMDELHLALHFPVAIGQEEANKMLKSAALIVYSNENGAQAVAGGEQSQRRRTKRRAIGSGSGEKASAEGNTSRQQQLRSFRASASSSSGRPTVHHRHRPHSAGQCRRAELYVDFAELNWQDWIMAPTGYEAYQCKGRCVHPMPSHLNTTNHAIVQSLIHSIDPSAAPAPSCVPVQMSAISILYRDLNDVIVVKTYPDMRVDACGCH